MIPIWDKFDASFRRPQEPVIFVTLYLAWLLVLYILMYVIWPSFTSDLPLGYHQFYATPAKERHLSPYIQHVMLITSLHCGRG